MNGGGAAPRTRMAPRGFAPRLPRASTRSSMSASSTMKASAGRWRGASRVVLDGHLQHRIYAGRRRKERRARRQPPQGPRNRADPARQFPQGGKGGRAHCVRLDRKSTRLNSQSIMRNSYAVFCLKKNKKTQLNTKN